VLIFQVGSGTVFLQTIETTAMKTAGDSTFFSKSRTYPLLILLLLIIIIILSIMLYNKETTPLPTIPAGTDTTKLGINSKLP
jgi:membrane protein CcdC involved in cytochrome C biogenesis